MHKTGKSLKQTINQLFSVFCHSTEEERDKTDIHLKTQFRVSIQNSSDDHKW